MLNEIKTLLLQNGIALSAPIALADCLIPRPYLLDRVGIGCDGTAVLFVIPYHTPACEVPERNCSRYAVGRDYHLFVEQLSERILPVLRKKYPSLRFAMFSDHSPIDERNAAARAGLGVLGRNGLLITEAYGSYVFLAELITSAPPPLALSVPDTPPLCEDCGACRSACPMLRGETAECLSALTQRKGELSAGERKQLADLGSVWGCDRCQEVCPHTKRAIRNGTVTSPIPFFHENPIPALTYRRIQDMTDESFSERAYAWRGRHVILRNLSVTEQSNEGATPKKANEEI